MSTPKVGEIYCAGEFLEPTYAKVVEVREDVILFNVWEVVRPGWQGGAGLDPDSFRVVYSDGPYPEEYVQAATEEAARKAPSDAESRVRRFMELTNAYNITGRYVIPKDDLDEVMDQLQQARQQAAGSAKAEESFNALLAVTAETARLQDQTDETMVKAKEKLQRLVGLLGKLKAELYAKDRQYDELKAKYDEMKHRMDGLEK